MYTRDGFLEKHRKDVDEGFFKGAFAKHIVVLGITKVNIEEVKYDNKN